MTARLAPTALRRFGSVAQGGRAVILSPLDPAFRSGRSLFPSRVFDPDELGRVLKDGHQSRKIGKTVQKGRLKDAPIFTLTLEERASCPRPLPDGTGCREWAACYGNNMQAAERVVHGPDLIAALARELTALAERHPVFLVRLHVLGDFWSVKYVRFWHAMLAQLPGLHVFGFTAHAPSSPIGRALGLMALDHGWGRAAIRFSGAAHELRAARVIGPGERDAGSVPCPAQSGGTDCCATCALCWQSERSISFRRHG